MLIIRQQQIEAFRPSLETQFVLRLVDWCATEFPALASSLGRPDLERRVRRAYARGRRYGFSSKRDIARFVHFDLKMGADFESQPGNEWMRPLLAHRELSAATRLYRLECRLERLAQIASSQGEDTDAGSH